MSLNTERLAKTMSRELSILLSREARDKNLSSVTITEVRVTNDLSYATVYYTVPDYLKEKIVGSLDKAKGFLRSELARRVKARKMPELVCKYDEALEYGNHINEILNKLNMGE